jgi:hypothetical protein
MSIENLSTSLTPDEYLKNVMRSDLANYRAFPDIKFTINTTSNVVLAGHPGFLLVGTFKDPASGVLDGFSNIGTIIGSKAYSIQYYSPEQTYPVYSTIYSKMIKSFEVSAGQNNTSPKNQYTTSTVSTYENRTNGVRVKYPSDWTVSGTNVSSAVSDSSFATFYSPSTSSFSPSHAVATISLGTETPSNVTTNLNNYAHHIALDFYANSGSFLNFKLFELNTNSILSGKPAYTIVGTYQDPSAGPQKLMEVGTIIGDKVYILQYIADASRYFL